MFPGISFFDLPRFDDRQCRLGRRREATVKWKSMLHAFPVSAGQQPRPAEGGTS